jgi:hypothetical protein
MSFDFCSRKEIEHSFLAATDLRRWRLESVADSMVISVPAAPGRKNAQAVAVGNRRVRG